MVKKYSYIVSFFIFSVAMNMQAATQINSLKSVYYHPSEHAADVKSIELGNIIFYFEAAQRVDLLSVDKVGQHERRTFFFPLAQAKNDDVRNMVEELANISSKGYSFKLEEVEKPLKGIRLVIQFDPALMGIAYEVIESYDLVKTSIVFRFNNKDFLNTLRNKGDHVLRLTHNSHKPRVIIDCGHGGDDDGALGCHGIKEKDINLNIGIAVAYLLKKKGFDVLMTRIADETKTLSERVNFANSSGADLFVSIHSNSAANDTAVGLETFSVVPSCVHQATASLDSVHLDLILEHHKSRLKKSRALAHSLQASILTTIRPIHENLRDRKAKQAVLLVLLGTVMPSALVEVGFISNPAEAARLNNKRYQRHMALGICRGILNYFDEIAS
jgi:N-acetylmuramoyl-L-alanine amidase